jgi:hypothetical protein
MTNSTPNNINRRTMLRSTGIIAASGAVLAACGSSSASKTITRVGETPEITKLGDATVTDVVLLRTAMSVETMARIILTDTTFASLAEKTSAPVVAGFARAHTAHLTNLRSLISARGGEAYEEPNEKLMASYGTQALGLVADGKNSDDVLPLTLAIETLVASMYQYFISLTSEPALRASMIRMGVQSSRAAAVTAQLINPGIGAFAPGVDKDGVATVATLPSAFGALNAVQVQLGPVNPETGSRTTVSMDTPSLNSFIY